MLTRTAPGLLLRRHYEDHECIWHDLTLRQRLCCDGVDLVRLRIEGHGPRTLLCCDCLCRSKFVWVVFVDHGQRAVMCGSEGIAMVRVERGPVAAITDGGSGQHLAAVGIDDRHYLISATGEQAA